MAESVIRAGAPLVTLINVFTVDADDQQRLVDLWQEGTEEVMRHLPGFISATSIGASTAPRSSTMPSGRVLRHSTPLCATLSFPRHSGH